MHRFRTSNQAYGSAPTSIEKTIHARDAGHAISMTQVMDSIRKARLYPIAVCGSDHFSDISNAEQSRIIDASDEPVGGFEIPRKSGKGIYYPTSYEYGFKSPSAMHRPDHYFPKTNTFSKSFAGRHQRTGGLVTSSSRSRVHSQLDEYS